MRLQVHHVNQAAGGGSYVVIYEADVQLWDGHGVVVQVEAVEPRDTEPALVEEAKIAIGQGAEHVLSPLSKAASIVVHRLVVNSTDFKPSRFVFCTAHELKKLLDGL